MSQERCRSLDNAQEMTNLYIPERSPNRTQTHAALQHAPNTPEVCGRSFGGSNGDRNIICFPINNDVERNAEYLDDFEEPSFYDLPPNSSFDEVTCITPQAHVADVVKLDDFETSKHDQQMLSVPIDDIRNRIDAAVAPRKKDPPKIQSLLENPYEIPPPPKNPKDVIAIIRRARAIERLKVLEEAKASKKADKDGAKKSVKGITVQKKPLKHVPTLPKSQPAAAPKLINKSAPQKAGVTKKKPQTSKPEYPPDHIPDEWAAAILRTRKLAGLRTTNPKLLPKHKTQQAAKPKSLLRRPSTQTAPTTPTFENIMKRVAAIRSRTNAVETALEEEEKKIFTVTPQDELDEFKVLEELYGAQNPEHYPPMQQNHSNLQNRINVLKQQFLQTPSPIESDYETLEQQYLEAPYDNPQSMASELPSILRYKDLLQSRDAMAAAAAEIGLMQTPQYVSPPRPQTRSTAVTTKLTAPQRSRSPVAAAQSRLSKFDYALLENIEMPDFDMGDVPEHDFSAGAMNDAGFAIGDEVSLGEISMPDFDEDISLNEFGLEDITIPDLYDLSISADDLTIEPDYPSQIPTEKDEEHKDAKRIASKVPKDTSFFTSMVNAVVEGLKNIFSSSGDRQNVAEATELDLDISLPNMFESTPPPKAEPSPLQLEPEKSTAPKRPIVIPPHPKDPRDYKGMVRRARAIQNKKAEEANISAASAPIRKDKREKREVESTIARKHPKKKAPIQKTREKVYPPGEYSMSDVKAVARARSLAGLKNLSDLLNPERVAEITRKKALREAEQAAIEALPPLERMREKIKRMRQRMGGLPRLSIKALGTLEAIRPSLPKHRSKRKWGLRVDRRVPKFERLFWRDFGRVLIPAEGTQNKDMSPIAEDTQSRDEDLIKFSPIKPHEAQKRLRYLKEQAARQTAEIIRSAEEKQAKITYEIFPRRQIASPRTEETKREKIVTKIGPHGGPETVTQEVTEISTIENGEVHTSTRQVTTKTDEYGNVTRHVQEGNGFSGEEAIPEDLAVIEPPDILDISDIPPPTDPPIPTSTEIINRIRSNVQQRLSLALPNIPQSPSRSPSAFQERVNFPKDLTDEELFDIENPEFERTPQKSSPQMKTFSPFEKDRRMYAWGELPPEIPYQEILTPKDYPPPEPAKLINSSPKPKSPEGMIPIPPHPKDPKDYKSMIKRAQAIQQRKQQEVAVKTEPQKQAASKTARVSISRWIGPPPRDPRRRPRKRLMLKKGVQKEFPSEPQRLSEEYRKAVARARLIHGLENRTAALNPAIAAKLAAEEAAQYAFDALPQVEKIKRRMVELREIPAKKSRVKPSADILGALAAIRANMPPLEEVLQQPSMLARELPVSIQSSFIDLSLKEFENMEAILKSDTSLEEFEAFEAEAQKLYDHDTPKRSERYRPKQLIMPPIRPPSHPEEFSRSTALTAPSMRMLRKAGYFQNIGLINKESLPERETMTPPHITPISDTDPASIYYDLMQDFRIPAENVLETSQLMLKTPPRNIQERFQRVKEAQSVGTITSESTKQLYKSPATPALDFIPIRLISTSGAGEHDQLTSSISTREQNEWLINIDEIPEREIYPVKQLGYLEDMPFDELDNEIEPSLADISFEKPLSPPPKPSDIIRRIRSTYYQQLSERPKTPVQKSPEMLKLPAELPDEELLELSAPFFTQTPRTPPLTYKSPGTSLPMAYGAARSVTPVTLSPRKPTSTPRSPRKDIKGNISTPEGPIIIPPHPKHPRDYAAMIKRARAIHILNKQMEAVKEAPPPKILKKGSAKPRKKLVLRQRAQKPVDTIDKKSDRQKEEEEAREYAEPPPLSQEYREAVAKARLLRGLKNRTAALNPKIAAKISAKRAAEEAGTAAFNALPEIEKIKVRMERLRRNQHRRRGIKPTIEQIAYLEALKQIGEYQASSSKALTPPSRAMPRSVLLTPRAGFRQKTDSNARELNKLAEFEPLEQFDKSAVYPLTVSQDFTLKQHIDNLKSHLLKAEEFPQIEDESLAEFEALEALEAQPVQQLAQPVTPLDISKLVSNLRLQLDTPPMIDPRERNRKLLNQIVSPVKTSEIRYSPTTLPSSPCRGQPTKRAEKSTTQITKSGNHTIKEEINEISEIVDGKLQHFRTLVTTATDPQGNVTSQINKSKSVSARDRLAEIESAEDLGDIEEPSFLDTTPLTPLERPRPRDIIERVGRQLKENYRPEVPTGHLIELRTPPRILPLPADVTEEELLDLSSPPFERTPTRSPVRSGTRSPIRSLDISLPKLFAATPPPTTPSLHDVSPPGKRKNLVIRKPGEIMATKTPAKKSKLEEGIEYTVDHLALPEHFAKEVALARKLAGLKNRTAALNPKMAAREAVQKDLIRKAKEVEAAHPRSPIKDYAAVLSRMKEIKEKGAVVHSQPSLAAAAYLDALKGAIQVRQESQHEAESPKTRYGRILATRTFVQPTVEAISIGTPIHEEIPYSPVRFGDNLTEFDMATFENLEELEKLSELEQPSYMDFSQYQKDQYMPLTPPPTPPPTPSAIIRKIRQQYEQQRAAISTQRPTSPEVLKFPDDLPEEELFELSEPSFSQSPIKPETPIKSPNVTIPHYFEESTPSTGSAVSDINTTGPPLLGVFPGIKVKTPHGPIGIPAHPTNVAATIRRAQLVQKIQEKKAAEEKAGTKAAKVRVPISRRIPKKASLKKEKLVNKSTESIKIPAEYLAQVARSRRIARLKPKTAQTTSIQMNVAPPSANYAALMERYAALREANQKTQVLTARELTHRQHLINRQQMKERRRLLHELECLRQQQGFEYEQIKTPPTARERLQVIKSRIPIETPTSSAYPYSPIKTPEDIDMPQYQPLLLAKTPPYQFLENVSIPDIENTSMPFDDVHNYTLDFDAADQEDIEFQLAELANAAYAEFENINTAELERAEMDDFDIAERIKMLKNQLLDSSDNANADD